ncbi:MAG TPA: hypothetical protein HA254_00255 [Candidatus Diapherotrites archaeon]|uniref:Uncharacterized protein n=1 Tax=Candidatus Iainarchaeum sp. TaxID=3101447 RepID=A0A7J4IUG6_9ARCH|nr:hypothetical protein [Candidatus Diapherotrites archaeon]
MDRGGQAVVFDFALAFMLFVIAWVFVSTQTDAKIADAQNTGNIESMRIRAEYIANSLVENAGSPPDWESRSAADVNSIGLAFGGRELDEEKLAAFANFSGYDDLRSKLGTEGLDFYFEFHGAQDFTAGLLPAGDATKVSIKRIVAYRGELGVATLTLYRLE